MARRILFTRRDHMQEAAASFVAGVGFWNTPLTSMLDMRPQVAAEAVTNLDFAATRFAVDLGNQREVGLIAFAALRATRLALMEVDAGLDPTFASNVYSTGVVTAWPQDATAGENDAWGNWTLDGVYQQDEYAALGMPRVLIPPAPIKIRYIRVKFRDPTAVNPLSIGCFGVYQTWEPPRNLKYDWELTPIDGSDIARVPGGSAYVDRRPTRRTLQLGLPALDSDEVWARGFGLTLAHGKSRPLWVMPFSDAGEVARWEKAAIYGLVSEDSVLSNPFFGRYALPVKIEQLV